jgi:LysR family transcriptional regulator, low CO2-responsive transcriptional regulator
LRIVADAAHHLLHILGTFRERYPGIQVSVRSGNTETVISSLYSYEADIGVLGEIPTGRDFEILKLNSTPIVAFVSAENPLSTLKSVTLEELTRLPLVMRERGSKTRQKLQDLAMSMGIDLKPAIEAEGREAVREIVASGAGVGFVSSAEFGQDSRLIQIPIAAPEMLMDEALICLRDRSAGKLVRVFLDIAKSLAPAT